MCPYKARRRMCSRHWRGLFLRGYTRRGTRPANSVWRPAKHDSMSRREMIRGWQVCNPRDLDSWSLILPWTYRLGEMDDFQTAKVERLRRRFKGVERQSEGSILYTTVGVGLCSWLGLDRA